ncbi:hypothetical protein [Marivita cryptomonadis]|uniref:hypothetical protein n=1 Tax=Marivita cryptomonadis TaxID=505252 RepID=UPI00391D60F1
METQPGHGTAKNLSRLWKSFVNDRPTAFIPAMATWRRRIERSQSAVKVSSSVGPQMPWLRSDDAGEYWDRLPVDDDAEAALKTAIGC